jgi:glycosyltransferase involved in cell wall biosynthesis
MRAAIFLTTLEPHGVARVVADVATLLIQSGWEIDLLVQDRSTSENIPAGVRVFNFDGARVAAMPRRLRRYLVSETPSVLVPTHLQFAIVCAAANATLSTRNRIPFVGWEHIDHRAVSRSGLARLKWAVLKHLVPIVGSRAAAYVGVSQGVCRSLQDLGVTDPILMYNPGPSIDVIPANELRIRYSFVAAGRFAPQKDFECLIEAFSMVVRECPVATLTVYGSGEEEALLRKKVRRLGIASQVAFPGWCDDLMAELPRFETFVLSSRYEGFGLVLVEALASGCRIVSFNIPSGPSEILDGGSLGHLVPDRSSQSLAAAMMRSLEDGCLTPLEVAERKRKLREFDSEHVRARFSELLAEVAT